MRSRIERRGRSVAAKVIDTICLFTLSLIHKQLPGATTSPPRTAHEALLRLSDAEILVERPLLRRKKGRPCRMFAATELIDLLSNQ